MTVIGQILHYDENSSVWWKFITAMTFIIGIQIHWCNKIHHCDENSSILSELIFVMKIHLGDEIDHCNINFINWWLFSIVIKMNKTMKIHHGHKIHQLMKIYIFDRCSLFWWKFITAQKLIIVLQFIIVIKLHLSGVNLFLWEFSSVMKIWIWIKID